METATIILISGAVFSAISAIVGYLLAAVRAMRNRKELEQSLEYEKSRRVEAEKVQEVVTGGKVDIDELRRLQEKRDADAFERNSKAAVLLESVTFAGLPVLGDGTWTLQPGVNVLLGRNGYGKSLVLRELAALLSRSDERSLPTASDGRLSLLLKVDEDSKEVVRGSRFDQSPGPLPILAIPDSRFVNRAEDTLRPVRDPYFVNRAEDTVTGRDRDPYAKLSRYGAYHFLKQVPYNTIVQGLLHSLCLDYWAGPAFDQPLFQLVIGVFAGLTDSSFRFAEVERIDPTGFRLKVYTEGNSEPVLIQAASQGTLSVLAIFGLIYRFLSDLADKNESAARFLTQGREDKPTATHRRAIVIIDELDAHLHPSWQQRIVGLLRKNFPNVQFIVSAHSPLLVAGCGAGEVSVMRKKGSRFEIETVIDRDFIGAKAEDIYDRVFGITDGEDEVFLDHSKLAAAKVDNGPRIAELRAKQHLSTEEELELRQLQNEEVFMRRALAVEDDRAQEADKLATLEADCSMLRIEVRNMQEQLKQNLDELDRLRTQTPT